MISTTTYDDKYTSSLEDLFTEHNSKSKGMMAASTVFELIRIRKKTIRESLRRFTDYEHRLKSVLKIKEVDYVNDSAANSINATYYSLSAVKGPTIWIAGGKDYGNDYTQLLPLVHEKVVAIICIGADNNNLISQFDNCVDIIAEAASMNKAVQIAYQLANKGDTVLLSPANEAHDGYLNFEDRGGQFVQAVRNL